jgi:hypothetical protein
MMGAKRALCASKQSVILGHFQPLLLVYMSLFHFYFLESYGTRTIKRRCIVEGLSEIKSCEHNIYCNHLTFNVWLERTLNFTCCVTLNGSSRWSGPKVLMCKDRKFRCVMTESSGVDHVQLLVQSSSVFTLSCAELVQLSVASLIVQREVTIRPSQTFSLYRSELPMLIFMQRLDFERGYN